MELGVGEGEKDLEGVGSGETVTKIQSIFFNKK